MRDVKIGMDETEEIEMGWFEIQELPHDIVAIREPYHVQDVISYLIKGSESCLLWDTGLGMFDIKEIVDKLTDKPVYVVNSHYHFDHLGGNGFFHKVHVYNDEIIINRLKNGITAADVEQNFTKQAIKYEGELPFNIEAFSIKPTDNFVTIEDGHIFDLGDRRFKVVHTPGSFSRKLNVSMRGRKNGIYRRHLTSYEYLCSLRIQKFRKKYRYIYSNYGNFGRQV